jgi:hypothetical protein
MTEAHSTLLEYFITAEEGARKGHIKTMFIGDIVRVG